ncbi:MAG: tryptophan synthase subunit alpha [Spirochaetales bacterium]|nr:tryptophan synthase subunit alpha [Spirochaetales bacterium]
MEETNIITHFIAGYPDLKASLATAKGLIDGGAAALEMQIPFSDPSADGPVIENASRKSLEAGFKVADGFNLVKLIHDYADVPVYIMSYSAIVYNMGVDKFVQTAVEAGVKGLIIPDLTPGNDEGLYASGKAHGIDVVPVIIPAVSDERMSEIMAEKPEWAYLALRSGITGSYTKLDDENIGFLERLKKYDAKIMAGFGIRTPEQVEVLAPHCDAAVVGSYIVDSVTKLWNETPFDYDAVKTVAEKSVRYLFTGRG